MSLLTNRTETFAALSVWQPWASLIAQGHKEYETRNWATNYRGEILICAAKKRITDQSYDYLNCQLKKRRCEAKA
ncbi:MAG: ASCH domain-containing protein [Roseofilum sp. SID3]|uniref:ASCH domain-containing protein n=1 Tax=Roseofilum sp. SID3 TaxID=2821499 RepID=UPI001B18AA5E|nr:ASCH domain-containing protein [Roseofilum sp. SID3]MBP0015307.1 ASCH domain-containing protein [Roseofilum sp. SID3]